ncbi:MAG: tetratricopeptide repeat protein [candidate division Zixibacteria bacterium]|nr:tetratricopeptide repeat protein [candidate division Zixibacteria bacterium]
MEDIFSIRYKLLERLGKGGLGEVYHAFDSWEEQNVAIKLANQSSQDTSQDPEFGEFVETLSKDEIENFKEEYRLLKQLKHPGLVEAYDFNYSGDCPYFSMEYIQGKSLGEAFREGGSELLSILMVELCEVLEFIHQRGIIHCDLKPDNIKVTSSPFKIKLLDFGLAERKGSKINQQPKGTLYYMSPEVFQKKPLDERSDLYSLGIILYQATTSRLPFSYSDPVQIVSAHLEEEPKPPKELNPQLPESLNDLILRLLAKDPKQRFGNATELKEFLKEKEKIDTGQKNFPSQDTSQDPEFGEFVLQHLFSGGLVNREEQLSRLWNGVLTARQNEGKFFLVEGEGGVGKTELLDELKLKSQLEGIAFFKVRCLEKESQTYTPLIEAVTRLFPYLKNRCRLLIAKYSQPLKLLIPQLELDEEVPQNQARYSAEDKESLLSGLADFLVEASIVFPFAICFEDLGWADSGTISVLKRLSENINQSRIFLCASLRTEKIEEKKELKELINSLVNKDWFETVKLNRFDLTETDEFITSKLAGSDPPKEAIKYLFSHTSGNPLFLIEILKLLIQKGIITLRKGEWFFDLENLEKQEIPKEVGKVLLNNLARYDENTKKFLEFASLIGERFDLESAKFLSELSDDQIFEILFVLLKDEVIHKITEQAELTYEFSSQSLQKLLYERHTLNQRKKLHLKLGDFLEQREKEGIPQPKEKLAHHYLNSTDYQKAHKYSLEAASETQKRFAHTQTLAHINNAIKSAQKLSDQNKFLDALMKRGDFYNSIGELDKELRDYKEILKEAKGVKDERFMANLYKNMSHAYGVKSDYKNTLAYSKKALDLFTGLKDDLETANTLNIIGDIYRVNSEYDKALEVFNKALKIEQLFDDQVGIALILANIGIVYALNNDYEKARKHLKQYLEIVKTLGLKNQIGRALNNLSNVHYLLGEFDTSVSYLLESLELNSGIGNEREKCYNYDNLGENLLESGEHKRSLEYSQEGLNLAQRIGLPVSGKILFNIARAYLEMGDYEESNESFEESLKFAKQIGDKTLIASILLNWAKLYLILNDKEEQKELLNGAKQIVEDLKDGKLFLELYEVFGIMNLKEGKAEESIEYFKKAEELISKLRLKNKKLSLNLNFYEGYSKLDQRKNATKYLEEARKLAEITQSKPLKGEFYLKSAENEMNNGNLDKSLSDLKIVLEIAQEIGKPELIWRNHHLLGKLHIKNKDYEAGYKEFEKAFVIVKDIAQKMEDKNLRESYMKDKKELMEDLKKVAGVMVRVE